MCSSVTRWCFYYTVSCRVRPTHTWESLGNLKKKLLRAREMLIMLYSANYSSMKAKNSPRICTTSTYKMQPRVSTLPLQWLAPSVYQSSPTYLVFPWIPSCLWSQYWPSNAKMTIGNSKDSYSYFAPTPYFTSTKLKRLMKTMRSSSSTRIHLWDTKRVKVRWNNQASRLNQRADPNLNMQFQSKRYINKSLTNTHPSFLKWSTKFWLPQLQKPP